MISPDKTQHKNWLKRIFRQQFVRNQRGATAIEFGLLALPFFLLIGAILETSLVFLSGQIMDSAVGDASRHIRTGQAIGASFDTAKFRALICDELYGLFDCDGLFIDVNTIDNFNAAKAAPPVDSTCTKDCTWTRADTYAPGSASSTVMVQVYYKWPTILNFGGATLANLPDNSRLLATVRVFRNEPF